MFCTRGIQHPLHYLLEKTSEVAFCNLRNKYGIEKRKIMTSNTNGSGTEDIQVQISEL